MPTLGLSFILHHFAEARHKTQHLHSFFIRETFKASCLCTLLPWLYEMSGPAGRKVVLRDSSRGLKNLTRDWVLLTSWDIISTALEGQVGVGGSNRGISVMPNLKLTTKGGQGAHLLRLPAHRAQLEGQLLIIAISQGWQQPLDTWDISSKQFQPILGQSDKKSRGATDYLN